MRVAFCSRTAHAGLPERMARALNEHTSAQARALVPGTWLEGRRVFAKGEGPQGSLWNVRDREQVDDTLRWADVVHCMYNTSIQDLGRADLEKSKLCVWHLATRWNEAFRSLFPSGPGRTIFALSAEGWDRYDLGHWGPWRRIPVVFLLDDPAYRPAAWSKRTRHVSMSPRIKLDTTDDGRPIAAPRSQALIAASLRGLKFRRLHGLDFRVCMRRKGTAWVGIDDLVNPLIHQSGMEYLALGVPCLNALDPHLANVLAQSYGSAPPFLGSSLETVRANVTAALRWPEAEARERGRVSRAWMERNAHPRDVAARYLALYDGARCA